MRQSGNTRSERSAGPSRLGPAFARHATIISLLVLAGTLPWDGASEVVLWLYAAKGVIVGAVIALAAATTMPRLARALAWAAIAAAAAAAVFGILDVGLGSRAWLAWLGCGFAVAGAWQTIRQRPAT